MSSNWTERNKAYLMAEVVRVRACLEERGPGQESSAEQTRDPAEFLPALEALTGTMGLSTFERAILVLCAGMELDASFGGLCAAVHGDAAKPYPTFGLAMAKLHAPHWSALIPEAPLRYWRLLDFSVPPGVSLTATPLRIDERILHFLMGVRSLDTRLTAYLEEIECDEIEPRHVGVQARIQAAWTGADGRLPAIQLRGSDESSKRSVAASASAALGLRLYALSAADIPTSASEFEGFLRLWERESALIPAALYIQADASGAEEDRRMSRVSRLLAAIRGPVMLSARDRWDPEARPMLTLEFEKPDGKQQRRMWETLLDEAGVSANGQVKKLTAHFNLDRSAIRASAREALASGPGSDELGAAIWDACRTRMRPRLEDLAQRIEPAATWDDLVLPEDEKRLLREIANQVEHRATVYEDWGLGAVGSRGLGITALFAGASGTGKTMAAEVMANALRLDLYRIDLSRVVSKYIGETEKNLRRLFDAAEDAGAILFFDEADALFGKRSEVKDSHDRYANIEINYLLQRMEQYRGLAVLATNMKSALDPAFLRRIRFVVNFPFPGASHRVEMWRRAFTQSVPTEGLDLARLSRMDLTGGNIRNIVLNAAFLAAGEAGAVRMAHVWRAARAEYAKLEKPLNEMQLGVVD